MTTLALALPPTRAAERRAYRVALVVGGSLLVAALAQLQFPLPFTPVPVTGQTLGVLLVGAALGPELAVGAMLLYLAEGAIGLPFFAAGGHGWLLLTLTSASGGYLWGFVAMGAVVGALARRGWDRSLRSSISAMLLGEIVLYAIGVPWLAAATGVGIQRALVLGLYPFVLGDVLKLFAAAALLPAAWRLTRRSER
ncbi:MAG: biotin transporter BioY [Actinomycetota bacterium]